MRTLKNDKYASILTAARNEFINKGFKDASMRDIARCAKVGLSNIYNYFRNKDEIYLAIVKPARDDLFAFVTEQHTEECFDVNRAGSFGHHEETIECYIELVEMYKDELRLLLFHSEGSSVGDFRESFTEHLTRISYDYMQLEKKHYPDARAVSHFFIHTMSSWMVSTLGEIVTHELSRRRVREFFREYFRFEFAGWRELTGT